MKADRGLKVQFLSSLQVQKCTKLSLRKDLLGGETLQTYGFSVMATQWSPKPLIEVRILKPVPAIKAKILNS